MNKNKTKKRLTWEAPTNPKGAELWPLSRAGALVRSTAEGAQALLSLAVGNAHHHLRLPSAWGGLGPSPDPPPPRSPMLSRPGSLSMVLGSSQTHPGPCALQGSEAETPAWPIFQASTNTSSTGPPSNPSQVMALPRVSGNKSLFLNFSESSSLLPASLLPPSSSLFSTSSQPRNPSPDRRLEMI